MEKRSVWDRMVGGFNKAVQQVTRYRMMTGYSPTFTSFGGNAYASDVVRATVHAVATNAAKLKPKHVRRVANGLKLPGSELERLLSLRPNPHMNAYDFYYKIITHLYMKNNAFVLVQRDGIGRIVGFYPIFASYVEALEAEDELYLRFQFSSGRQLTVYYGDVIHLRRFFYESDLFGENNDIALLPTLELIHTANQGIINAVKSSADLRGIIKFTTTLKPDDLKKQRDLFVKDYLDMSNNGGVAATDGKFDYTPVNSNPKLVNSSQQKFIEEKVYKFFNVNESIVTSKYNENDWNAFYESVLEPLAVQMSLEFTTKCFTDNEQRHGNEILFEANRLQYASNTTKVQVVTMLMDRGMMSKNQGLEVFNMPPIEDGDKRILSLNFVDADKANQYQLGKGEADPKPDKEENDDADDGT